VVKKRPKRLREFLIFLILSVLQQSPDIPGLRGAPAALRVAGGAHRPGLPYAKETIAEAACSNLDTFSFRIKWNLEDGRHYTLDELVERFGKPGKASNKRLAEAIAIRNGA
jgi:hypothetical protein